MVVRTVPNGLYKKVLASSLIQYVAFLITFILTQSFLISFVVYLIFLPAQVKFLTDMQNHSVNDVYKVKSKLSSYLLLSMFFTFVFGVLSVLLIFPAIIFLANYALVFDVAGKEDLGLTESFKLAKEKVKGYRGRIAWLCIVFMFILLLLVGFGMLLSWLISLALPTFAADFGLLFGLIVIPSFYFVGAFFGISLFMIFVLPVALICISNTQKAIEADKKYLETVALEEKKEEEKQPEEVNENENAEENEPKKEDENPADYIS